jgi:predicted nucleotidyltransferase
VGTSFLWKANRQSYAYAAFARLLESISAVPTPLEALKEDILRTLPLSDIERIVLFGSIAKKRERRGSDIDLFVLVKGEGEKARVERAFESLSLLCLEKFGHPLSPYLRTPTEISARGKLKLDKELGSGILLHPSVSRSTD